MRFSAKGLLIGALVWIPGGFLAAVFPPTLLLFPFFSAYPAVLFGCGFLPAVLPSFAAVGVIAWRLLGYRTAVQHAGGDAGLFLAFGGVMLGFLLLGGLFSACAGAWAAAWEAKRRKEIEAPAPELVRSKHRTVRVRALPELEQLPALRPEDAVVVFSEDVSLAKALRSDAAAREALCRRYDLKEEKGLGPIAFRFIKR